jgi:hypothetical protein
MPSVVLNLAGEANLTFVLAATLGVSTLNEFTLTARTLVFALIAELPNKNSRDAIVLSITRHHNWLSEHLWTRSISL